MVSKMKSRPPEKKVAEIEEFISGAAKTAEEGSAAAKQEPGEFPWEAPGVRTDVLKGYNVRFPEPYMMKLRYIAEHTPDSMNKFCINVLKKAIDEKMDELTG